MREKVRDFIYLDSERYMSLDNLKVFYWGTIIIPFCMIVMGVVSIRLIGVRWMSLFPLISIAVWSLLYWTFVLTVQRRKTKTFELRFLVNGVSGLFISSLFWILYASLSLLEDDPAIGFRFLLFILLFYLLFSILYIGLVILGVQKGFFKKVKEKSQTPKFLAISAFSAAILPSTGVMGMYASRILRAHASVSVQDIVGHSALVLVIFLPILAHINFVQYFYCKKYAIDCNEAGNKTSPALERRPKAAKEIKKTLISERAKVTPSTKADCSSGIPSKKKIPLIIKILTGIVSVPIFFFIIVFIVFLIKTIIEQV